MAQRNAPADGDIRGVPIGEVRATAAAVTGAMSSIFPAFLTGAIGVQLGRDLGVGEGALGLAIGCYFGAGAMGSAILGKVADGLGGSRALRVGLSFTIAAMLVIAALVSSALTLTLALIAAGFGNAMNQPAANLIIAERLAPSRMGFAVAVKQSGMPLATLVGGLMVPTVAETIGWRWAYLFGAAFALGAAAIAPPVVARAAEVAKPDEPAKPDLPLRVLIQYGAVASFAAAAAVSLAGFLVVGAEDAGIDARWAGLLLTAGSATGITSRLVHGRLADLGRIKPIKRASTLMYLGSIGFVIMSLHHPAAYLVGPILAFGCGWSWPGLINLSIIRNNPSAPAAATGIAQTGVFVGSGSGPIIGGQIIERAGFGPFWIAGAAMLVVAGTGASLLSFQLGRAAPTGLRSPT